MTKDTTSLVFAKYNSNPYFIYRPLNQPDFLTGQTGCYFRFKVSKYTPPRHRQTLDRLIITIL